MRVYRAFSFFAALTFIGCWGCRRVTTIHAQRKELIETVYASGKIVPGDEYSLAALCTGRIVHKFVKDGDTVHKGQLLYKVSAEDVRRRADAAAGTYAITENDLSGGGPRLKNLELALQNAGIRLRNDSLVYYRWKQLWSENIGTKNNLDNCRMNYEMAQNEKRIAEQQYEAAQNELRVTRNDAWAQLGVVAKELKEYSIRSDREGIVYETFKETGEAVRPNEVVALVGDSRRPEIRLAVDQQDIGRIVPGLTVLVQSDAAGSRVYMAKIRRVYPVMNEVDQTFRVDAEFADGVTPAFIHSSVEANIIIRRKAGCLVLPRSAMAAPDSVRIGERGRWKTVRVETGIATLDDIEVVSGIDEHTAVRPPEKTDAP
ncbi:MAG TPA: HlyD family efflux transporter periplasmic adaptor subunit [Puia sp.]|uniref:efflux RND transporter periplasmic adaptor subunit n=1 Tax=Puia sp. TaxID=2045100 RepID=UPI002C9DCD87|nr:HlyD family efflux transporter periplasmic adaptor subunit [Puia sp.]HVU94175.1 HlyD family efflux transporter periplasmic adaptor subunit [Puia sp.]